MLDLERLRRIKLYKKPFAHVLLASILVLDYRFPRRTHVVLEGVENIPRDRGVFLAMNHTDRFNYVPLQYAMHWRGDLRYITNWVKGKYYKNGFLARVLDITNNIPMPSRGYVIVSRFRQATGRAPDEGQYRLLRDLVDEKLSPGDARVTQANAIVARFLDVGLADYPGDSFLERFNALFEAMVAQVVALNRRALEERELNVLVFPQGTRSRRLSQGHTGLAQMTQHLGAPIVPVGCNGSDKLHSGNVPLSGGGQVVYCIGPPLEADGPELAPHRVPPEVSPLTRAARPYDDRYRAITEVVMGRINALLDPEYQFAPDAASDGVQGVARFL